MSSFSRREFLYGILLLPLLRAEQPDVILFNGKIWTVDESQPLAQAVAVTAGRLVAVGSDHEVLAYAGVNTRRFDLSRKTVLPGFIDAHSHPLESGRAHLRMVACDLPTIAQVVAALKARAAKTP